MFNWNKLGKVFTPQAVTGRPWLQEFAQAPSTLVLEDVVRVYFSCRPQPDSNGQYVSYSAYVDLDRADLFKIRDVARQPILKLGGLGEFDEFGTYPVSVIEDGKQVRAYYAGWTRCESVPFNVAIGCALSADGGKTFEKIGSGPVLSYSVDEPFVLSGPKVRRFNGLFHLFYISGRKWKLVGGKAEPVYKIRMATSMDGVRWEKVGKDLIPSRIEEDEAQASPDVFYANGKYHMFFCYRHSSDFRDNKDRGYRIGHAWSDDQLNWTRDDDHPQLHGTPGEWDSDMQCYPNAFECDGQVYLLYNGNQFGRFGFGLAMLEA